MSETIEPMSQKEYLAHDGACCPYCRSTNITGGSVTVEAGTATQEIGCDDCDAEWADEYCLVAFSPQQ